MLKLNEIKNYNIEDFSKKIYENEIDTNSLRKEIEQSNLNNNEKEKILQAVTFAFNRVNKSLEAEYKILFFIIPFGLINRLYQNETFNVQENLKKGFYTKVKEYQRYSLYGTIFYAVLITILVFLNR